MARYSSSDSAEDYRRSKKKKRRRSRSRSASSAESYTSSKRNKKSKKSKKKHTRRRSMSRSRSRSAEYRRRRSTSRTRGRRSRSRGRRSRSRSGSYTRHRNRRSTSRSRRKSRSRSFTRRRTRSRSFSRRKSRSRSRSFSRRRSRSISRSKVKRRSRSRSRSKNVTSRSSSVSRDSKQSSGKPQKEDPCANIPGFENMSAAEQNEVRMKMALKAAAETDARLREQGVLLPNKKEGIEMVYDDDNKRQKAIAEIEDESFAQQSFTSNRGQQKVKEETADDIHEAAMFGDGASLPTTISKKGIVYSNTDSLLAPVFYEDTKAKWERWAKYVKDFRKAKLEGEEMT